MQLIFNEPFIENNIQFMQIYAIITCGANRGNIDMIQTFSAVIS